MAEENDFLSFLDEAPETPVVEQPVVETPAVEAAVVEKPVVEEVVETPVVETLAENVEPKPGDQTVPLATFLDLRGKYREATKAKPAAEEETVEFTPPDPKTQPTEYAAFQTAVMELSLTNERMNNSEDFAREKHGDELVDKAKNWATARMDTDPSFAATITGDRNPYKKAIELYNDHVEYEAWKTERAAKKAGTHTPTPEAPVVETKPAAVAEVVPAKPQPVVKQTASPKSIADIAAAGSKAPIAVGEGQAFDGFFGGS